jgi:hypothetical protein
MWLRLVSFTHLVKRHIYSCQSVFLFLTVSQVVSTRNREPLNPGYTNLTPQGYLLQADYTIVNGQFTSTSFFYQEISSLVSLSFHQ